MVAPEWIFINCPNEECGEKMLIVVDQNGIIENHCGHCWIQFRVKKKESENDD